MGDTIRIGPLAEAGPGQSDLGQTLALLRTYIAWIGIDLSFQDIDRELAGFPGPYQSPDGAFLVAKDGDRVLGCVGLRKLGPGLCEMKRLYVEDEYKGRGLGRALVLAILAEARARGYTRMRLDTLDKMGAAQGLYRSLGFREIPQYTRNPIPGAVFLELDLVPGKAG